MYDASTSVMLGYGLRLVLARMYSVGVRSPYGICLLSYLKRVAVLHRYYAIGLLHKLQFNTHLFIP